MSPGPNAAATAFPRPFGPYVLVAELGRGGMGEVYLARSGQVAGIAKLCVIKTMRRDVGEPEVAHRRFLDEARISVSLGHANICTVYDVGQVGGASYIAMEYAGRCTLRDVQNRARELGVGLPEDAAIWVLSRVLEGLDHAHGARDPMTGKPLHVVHRDVSPQNVMVRHDGSVKLIDFGLARSDVKAEQTQSGMVAGKLTYMAPEQVRSEPIDARADQFAAAVMLYELVSGERFYEGLREHEIWSVAATGGFRPRRWEVLSADLEVTLSVALAAEPKDRFPSCEALLEALASGEGSLGAQRAGAAKRFKQVLSELFPGGEEEERIFLKSLPEPAENATAALAAPAPALSSPVQEDIAPSARASDDDTAAIASRAFPARGPLLAAASAALLVVVVLAGIRLLGSPADVSPQNAVRPAEGEKLREDVGAVATNAQPNEPGPVEKAPVEQAPVEKAPVEQAPIEQAPIEQALVDDDRPLPVDVRNDSSKDSVPDPRARETQRRTHPVNGSAPVNEPISASPIDEIRARLSRCSNACALVWRKQLEGRTSIPDEARTSLRICLDRCDGESK